VCIAGICRRSHCGDGVIDPRPEAGEVCDDGNTEPGDGCRADCRGLEICGDGLVDEAAGEVCDDGNLDDNDQCTRLCDRIRCGDGLLSGLEPCDQGPDNSDTRADACRTDCSLPACGDGVVDSPDTPLCWSMTPPLLVPPKSNQLRVADFNNDGRDDLLVWSTENTRFDLYLSEGDGSWTPGGVTVVGYDVEHLTVADVNADGFPDVIVAAQTYPSLLIYLGSDTGIQTPPLSAGSPVRDLNHVTVGDFDGDGVADLAAQYDPTCEIDVIYGNGDGTFGAWTTADVAPGHCWANGMRAADFNHDGVLDLVVATGEDGVFVMAGDGSGGLVSPPVYRGPTHVDSSVRDLAVADVNGDQLPDILYPEQHPPQTPMRVLINQGNFQFTEAPGSPLPLGLASLRFDVGDLDGNTTADLVVVDYLATVVFLAMGAGDGTFNVLTPPQDGMAMSADDVVIGHFYDHQFGGVAMLKIAERQVTFWALEP